MAWSVVSKINLEGKIAQNGADLLKKIAKLYENEKGRRVLLATPVMMMMMCYEVWIEIRANLADQPPLVIRDLNGSG